MQMNLTTHKTYGYWENFNGQICLLKQSEILNFFIKPLPNVFKVPIVKNNDVITTGVYNINLVL